MNASAAETDVPQAEQELPELLSDLRRLLELRNMSDELSRQAKPVNAEIDAIQERVIERMGGLGMDSTALDGHTFTRTTTPYPSIKDGCKEQVIAALNEMGLGDKLVTVNHPALKAKINEWIKEDSMPSGMADMIKVFDKHSLSIRKR